MKIVAVDSACSTLDNNLIPKDILAMVGIIVDYPYEQPSQMQVIRRDYSISDPTLLVDELKLCQNMLDIEKADYVHLDISLGGINLLELREEDLLFKMPLSDEGRTILRLILPQLQGIARSIDEKYHIPVLAIGKRSGPVRLAELYASAYGIARAIEKFKDSKEKEMFLGLPLNTSASINGEKVIVASEEPLERNLRASAPITAGVRMSAFLNPIVRRYQTLRLTPEEV